MTTKTNKGNRGNQPELFAAGKPKGAAGGKTGRKGRKPVAPVKVGKERNWGPIAMFTVVGLLAAGIIGYAFWAQLSSRALPWQEQAATIEGIVDYRETSPEILTNGHRAGPLQYEVIPPVGGDHNEIWQNCQGDVYTAPIANEHAVHSLEHGAIWVTYHPDLLTDSELGRLAGLIEGTEKLFLSPYPELDAPISLQAWGYQLKVDSPGDSRINEFIRTLRVNASLEGPTARCDGGVTSTGTTPIG